MHANNNNRAGLIEVAAKITGRRYCSHHGSEVEATSGCIVERNKSKRWICYSCQHKITKRDAEIRAQIGEQ
jgi:hypothetical protein